MKKLLIIFFISPLFVHAQTTMYMAQATPSVTPTSFNANWNVTTGAIVNSMFPTLRTQINAGRTSAAAGAASPRKILIAQYTSAQLIGQTLNCTVTAQIRLNISSAVGTGQGFMYLRLINADGSVASELGNATTTNMSTSPATNRTFTTITLTSVAVTGGQRLCVEIGWNYSSGSNTTLTGTLAQQSNVATANLPVDNTTTTQLNPFFQFSQTLLFQTTGNFF